MSLHPMPEKLLFESREILLDHVRDADTRARYVVVIKRSVANWAASTEASTFTSLAWLFRRGWTRNSHLQQQIADCGLAQYVGAADSQKRK
jgi:hypothetical protein